MKVFFYQRNTHRKRQQETVEYCPSEIEILRTKGIDFVKDTVLSARKRDKNLNFKSKLARIVPLNTHWMPSNANQADYIYTWGCIPRGTRKKFVLEMDNPYCICYYNIWWFNILKPICKSVLLSDRCQSIVCISEACKKSIEIELGKGVTDKVKVVYPYITEHHRNKEKVGNPIEFLFVSTQFYLKGGRETIEAFKVIYDNTKNIHLTVITHMEEISEEYKNLSFVSFIEANLEKKELHEKYFTNADVFILPSYQDSFGMVYLEALSFGLPIIATRIYAMSEMVIDGKNGVLVNPPVHYFWDDYQLNHRYKDGSLTDVIKEAELFKMTVDELINAIVTVLDDRKREKMSEYSKKIFKERFAPDIREKRFLEAFE